jgi:hypothetical protein
LSSIARKQQRLSDQLIPTDGGFGGVSPYLTIYCYLIHRYAIVHAFSAAVCLAAICIHAPSSAFAAPSYMSLVTACDLAQAAKAGSKAKGGLVGRDKNVRQLSFVDLDLSVFSLSLC